MKLYQIFAMANLGDEKSLNHLIDMVRDGTLEDKRDAAFLLAGLDSDAANAQLEKLMETADPFTAVAAAAALVGHGHKKAYEFLLYTMKEGTPVVADEAERALLVSQEKTIDEFLNSAIGKEKDVILKNRMQEILYKRAPNRDFR